MRNRQTIVHWLIAHTKAIDVRRRDDKTYYVWSMPPPSTRASAASRRHPAHQVRGGLRRRAALFEAYGVHFDPALRDEIVARVDGCILPSYTGFVQPSLEPVVDRPAESLMCAISYPLDLEAQMLEYSGKRGAMAVPGSGVAKCRGSGKPGAGDRRLSSPSDGLGADGKSRTSAFAAARAHTSARSRHRRAVATVRPQGRDGPRAVHQPVLAAARQRRLRRDD